MSSLESSKTTASIGSILLMFPVVNIVGIILLFIGMKGLSEYYKDESIYKDAVRGLIFLIIAAIAIVAAILLLILGGMFSVFTLGIVGVGLGIVALLAVAVIVFVFYVLAAVYLRKSFNTLAQKSGEHMFETAGMLLLIGAVLTILFFIGLVLIFIAWIIATIAFFSIKVPQQQYAYAYTAPQTAAQPIHASRFCPNCGAPQDAYAIFCSRCGKQLPPP
jgi:uncharacterized membrane protein